MGDAELGEQDATRPSSRRSVLRIAANSTWAVPVIAVATAAPAAAVGSPVGQLTVTQAGFNGGLLGVGASATATVCNTGTVSILSPITMTFNVGLGLSVLPSVSGSGWTLTSSLADLVGLGVITVTYNAPLAAGACAPQVKLTWLASLNLPNRSVTASGTDSFGHKVTAPTKSF
ncbi:hypothetical protein [Nocardioides montaniterrae]